MGGDFAPKEIIAGARRAVDELGLSVTLVGVPELMGDPLGLDVVACDIVPALRSQSTSAAGTADGGRARGTLIAGLAIGLLVLATFLLAEMSAEHKFGITRLLGAMLAFSSAQIALAPLVLAPLLAGSSRFGTVTPVLAIAVLSAGAAIGLGTTIAGLVFGQAAALPWAVPACFAATTLLFVIGVLASRRDAALTQAIAGRRRFLFGHAWPVRRVYVRQRPCSTSLLPRTRRPTNRSRHLQLHR